MKVQQSVAEEDMQEQGPSSPTNLRAASSANKKVSASEQADPNTVNAQSRIGASRNVEGQDCLSRTSTANNTKEDVQGQRPSSPTNLRAASTANKRGSASQPDDPNSRISGSRNMEGQNRLSRTSTANYTKENVQEHDPCSRGNLQAASSSNKKASSLHPDDTETVQSRIDSCSNMEGYGRRSSHASRTGDSEKNVQGHGSRSMTYEEEDCFGSKEGATSQLEDPQTIFERISAACSSQVQERFSQVCPARDTQENVQRRGSCSMANLQAASYPSKKVSDCQQDDPKPAYSKISSCSNLEGQDHPSYVCPASGSQKNVQEQGISSATNQRAASSASKKLSASQSDDPKSNFSRISASSKPGSKDHFRRASTASDTQGHGSRSMTYEEEDCFGSKEDATSQLEDPQTIYARISAACSAQVQERLSQVSTASYTQEHVHGQGSCSTANQQAASYPSKHVSDRQQDDSKRAYSKISTCSNLEGQDRLSHTSTANSTQTGPSSVCNQLATSSASKKVSASQPDDPNTVYTRISTNTNLEGQRRLSYASAACDTQKGPSSVTNQQATSSASKKVSASQQDDPKTVYTRNSANTNLEGQRRLSHASAASDTQKNVQEPGPSSVTDQRAASSASKKVSVSQPDDPKTGSSRISASSKPGSKDQVSNTSPTNDTQASRIDDVFDEEADDLQLSQKEWKVEMEKRVKEGYREGADAGKAASVQQGFNNGFKEGVDLTMVCGTLRGCLWALKSWSYIHKCRARVLNELEKIVIDLDQYEENASKGLADQSQTPHPGELSDSIHSVSLNEKEQSQKPVMGEKGQSGEPYESNEAVSSDSRRYAKTQEVKDPPITLQQLVRRTVYIAKHMEMSEELVGLIEMLDK